MPARWLRRVAFASGLLLFASSPVSAHNPTSGGSRGSFTSDQRFSTAGSRSYVTSFPNERSGALTGDTSPTVTVTWSTAC